MFDKTPYCRSAHSAIQSCVQVYNTWV